VTYLFTTHYTVYHAQHQKQM